MNAQSKQQASLSRFLAGWLVLLLYVAAASPVGTGVTALVGALDREHQMQVSCAETGATIVLHHAANCAQQHHGLAARVLTLLANADDPTNPDHVIHFTAQLAAAKNSQVNVPAPVMLVDVSLMATALRLAGSVPTLSSIASSHPPADRGRAACVRTTVLLI
jgi:hypothetical protein